MARRTVNEARDKRRRAEAQGEALERANRELAEATRQAEEANKAKSDFLAVMSHELRTPLNAVVGYTELLELGVAGIVTEAQQRHLSRIRANARHLVGIIDEILHFARID